MAMIQNLISTPVSQALNGAIRVPGDKSISHRSVMFSAIAEGVSHVTGLLEGEDVLATIAAFRAMGVEIVGPEDGELTVHGVGMHGLSEPQNDLDMGNSGTAMRLLAGLLAAQSFHSTLVGDESLSSRPMGRVINPLTQMGAKIESNDFKAPLNFIASDGIESIDYQSPIASAQVKSAVLIAGLYANGMTSVTEPNKSRDHTETMLKGFGCEVNVDGLKVSVQGLPQLTGQTIEVPADISSAAFFMVLGLCHHNADFVIQNVSINPTRDGVIKILKAMGARMSLTNTQDQAGELVADISSQSSQLVGIDVPHDLIPSAIDEFPVFFVAAACAQGETVITGAEELRHKESDRIAVMATGLQQLGIQFEELEDGAKIVGGQLTQGAVECHHDHRIAMSFAVAGLVSSGEVVIKDAATVATSFPNFSELGNRVGMNLATEMVEG